MNGVDLIKKLGKWVDFGSFMASVLIGAFLGPTKLFGFFGDEKYC